SSCPLSFLWNSLDQTKDGYAFGRWGHLYVYLPRGLTDCLKQNPPEFRAIVLHEFAHIYNGDVHKTSLSFTIWWAFLGTSLPVFAVTLLRSPLERMVGMSGRVMVLFLLIYLTRNGVLRVREFYADLRSSTWDIASSALRLALESKERSSSKINTWQRIRLIHPDLGDRHRILHNPTPLLQMGFRDAFATGMATMIPFVNFVALAGFTFLSVTPSLSFIMGLFMISIPALILALLVIYIIGVGTWRTTFAAISF
ncbi:MAG: M48 family metalloprotease, partial [Brasilonema sp.]